MRGNEGPTPAWRSPWLFTNDPLGMSLLGKGKGWSMSPRQIEHSRYTVFYFALEILSLTFALDFLIFDFHFEVFPCSAHTTIHTSCLYSLPLMSGRCIKLARAICHC